MSAMTHRKGSLNRRTLFPCLWIASLIPTVSAFAETTPWQGPYVGVYTGSAFNNAQLSTTTGGETATSYFSAADSNAVNSAGSFTDHSTAVIAGIQAGQDWTWKQLVYGVVLDYSTLPLSASQSIDNATYPSSTDQYSVSTSMSTNWLFSLRARLGYATTLQQLPSLFYLTAGPALTQVNVNNTFSDNSPYAGTGGNSTSSYQLGWTAGAGMELLSFDHVSLNIEYLYVRIPAVENNSEISNSQAGFGTPPQSLSNPYSTSGNLTANELKIGLKYRF